MEGIVQQMGPMSKEESKKWRKQEKKKLQAIRQAFKVNSSQGQKNES